MATAPNQKASPWSMKHTSGAGNYEYHLCPLGSHVGSIVGLYDVGHQPKVDRKTGEAYERHELILVFELTGKKGKRPDGKPFLLVRSYTWSFSAASNFFGLVTSVTGMKFVPDEDFDPRSVLGVPVMVNVNHTQIGDKTYHNVGTITQVPEEITPGKPLTKPVAWSVLSGEPLPPTDDIPFIFGKSLKQMVEESAEWRAQNNVAPKGYMPTQEEADSIPF